MISIWWTDDWQGKLEVLGEKTFQLASLSEYHATGLYILSDSGISVGLFVRSSGVDVTPL